MCRAPVNQFLPMSLVDGPGNRCAIFFQGCNLNCSFCHNPETIKIIHSEEENDDIKFYSVDELFEKVKKIRPFIVGITTSGGECTIHHKFLIQFFKKIKTLNLNILVDTNGLIDLSNENMKELVELTDGFMLDIKALEESSHKRITGSSNKTVLKNMHYLAKLGKLEEIRTVLMSGEDNLKIVDTITKELSPYLKIKNIRYKLISYRPFGVRSEFSDLHSVSDNEKEYLKTVAQKNGFTDIVLI
ncbi:radical SAM protein [Peptoniphilus sp. oral taxon 386]|uniref:radical SAM protein n=1 Tax=Peptoniphilus sp. oral taxon 386 TaxID=652713 RepID=UPI0001DA9AB3|nr:radical SAM protein [Peptoniphilus sp. oral taxon 386]EFI41997.1 putative glycine radical enzyme activase, YjjW family [Peptoniphilus sp. oral taxon 386 str. F0131]